MFAKTVPQNLRLAPVAAPCLILAKFKTFRKFLKHIGFMLVSLHSQNTFEFSFCIKIRFYLIKLYQTFLTSVSCGCKNQLRMKM